MNHTRIASVLRQLADCWEFIGPALEMFQVTLTVCDQEGRLAYVSPSGVNLLELNSDQDVMDIPYPKLFPRDQRQTVLEAMARVLRGETPRFEVRSLTKKSRTTLVREITLSPIVGAQQIEGFVAVGRDLGLSSSRQFVAGDLKVDLTRRQVTVGGKEVKLTPTEYRLLTHLVFHAGEVVTHAELLRNAWGPEYGNEKEYLRVFVRQLRQKMEPDPRRPQYIITVPFVGYRFREAHTVPSLR